jgi:DNA-binding HxlR family transcriptional regulator
MQRPRESGAGDTWIVERAVVLQILRDDHAARWSRAELASEMPDFAPAVLATALERLEHTGVVRLDGSRVSASPAARRLDELELVAV